MEDYCGLTKARQHTVNSGSWVVVFLVLFSIAGMCLVFPICKKQG